LLPAKWASGDSLHGSNPEPLMPALGQKQTYAAHKVMSALPPIATAKADFRTRSCPLYTQKRTCAVQLEMSALGQKRTYAPHKKRSLFDDLISDGEHARRNSEADRLCGREVYYELEFG